jgi:hypothetical protein
MTTKRKALTLSSGVARKTKKKKNPPAPAKPSRQGSFRNGTTAMPRSKRPVTRPQNEIIDDWNWAYAEYPTGRLDAYLGQQIAIVNGRILGAGEISVNLRESVATENHLDPESVVILYVD